MEEFLNYILIDNWKVMVLVIPSVLAFLNFIFIIIDYYGFFKIKLVAISTIIRCFIVVLFAIFTYLDAVQIEFGTEVILQLSRRVMSLAIIIAFNSVFDAIFKMNEISCINKKYIK